jgi:hypothetical protein
MTVGTFSQQKVFHEVSFTARKCAVANAARDISENCFWTGRDLHKLIECLAARASK